MKGNELNFNELCFSGLWKTASHSISFEILINSFTIKLHQFVLLRFNPVCLSRTFVHLITLTKTESHSNSLNSFWNASLGFLQYIQMSSL